MTDNQKHIVKTADSIPISPMTDERQAERDAVVAWLDAKVKGLIIQRGDHLKDNSQ